MILNLPNPYEGFDVNQYKLDVRGWNYESDIFDSLISEIKPRLIVEVGTWLGASAIRMASICDKYNLNTNIVCVDTWLGALEFWNNLTDTDRFIALKLKNGYPTVYYQFLANVILSKQENRITPFPQTSQIAAKYFVLNNIKADLVYIDASHDYEDVRNDLISYQAAFPDAVLFGDDYQTWDGVRDAVDDTYKVFFSRFDYKLSTYENHWIIKR